ncbi:MULTISPECIES: TRAP transporter large permease subunit [Variovorax]|jgi:tripartite ATP-independent transporter DctM subunit|uniref:TRAP transporter large permease n=1 Tax=Variovorax TaxID=34072 RepID=UPI000A7BD8FB|nr:MULTISPECIES: TRAP transporter large permease subunit [Variovorax]MBN8757228.1 TRAP transporter large permease subunit [Variovorax sp.]UKI06360.1 TRAP transporter large permease subunit [Variovorax paradoxus]
MSAPRPAARPPEPPTGGASGNAPPVSSHGHGDAANEANPASFTSRTEHVLGVLVDGLAAALVLADVAVLLAGVVARFVLHQPLIWSDELASMLFIWLAMLGAVVALRRGEHMRMTAMVSKLPPQRRRLAEAIALYAALAFLAMVAWPAWEYASEERFITTPALDISNAWRAAALPVGVVLMGMFAVLRLFRDFDWKTSTKAFAVVVTLILAFTLGRAVFEDLGRLNLLVFFVGVVLACVLCGIPIAFAFGLGTFGYLALTTDTALPVIIGRMDEGMSHLILLAVPLFVFLGLLIEMTGMAKAMVAFLASLLGHVKGGLSYVLVGAMYLVSGISGSKAADMAAIAPALFPEMKKRGADEGELVALLAATGAQTETVPPSLVLITIGSVTGVSIAALFTGGLLPAVILGLMLCVVVFMRNRHEDLSQVARPPWKQVMRLALVALPALALPFVIRAAVVEGVATATEVSTIGIVYAVVAGLVVYRQFDWRRLGPMLVATASLSGAILLIIGTATAMAWGLTQSGFSRWLAEAMASLPGGAPMFLAVSLVTFVVLGSVLEGIPAIVLFGPLLFPIARQLGIHEVHYAMVVVLSMGLGLFAPPLGVGYYAACAIGRVRPDAGIRPIVGYMLALLVGTIAVAAIPWLSIGFL